jgi:probable rRNA maturation factor
MSVAVRSRQRRLRVNTQLLREIAQHALECAGAGNNNLSIVLVSDTQIAELNARFHHTEGPTDILSFDYGDSTAELVISAERVLVQANRYRTTPGRELALYVVHGILHLLGHDDRTPRQRARMRAAERRLLTQLAHTHNLTRLVSS